MKNPRWEKIFINLANLFSPFTGKIKISRSQCIHQTWRTQQCHSPDVECEKFVMISANRNPHLTDYQIHSHMLSCDVATLTDDILSLPTCFIPWISIIYPKYYLSLLHLLSLLIYLYCRTENTVALLSYILILYEVNFNPQ